MRSPLSGLCRSGPTAARAAGPQLWGMSCISMGASPWVSTRLSLRVAFVQSSGSLLPWKKNQTSQSFEVATVALSLKADLQGNKCCQPDPTSGRLKKGWSERDVLRRSWLFFLFFLFCLFFMSQLRSCLSWMTEWLTWKCSRNMNWQEQNLGLLERKVFVGFFPSFGYSRIINSWWSLQKGRNCYC